MVKDIGANFLELPLAKVVDVKSPIVYGIVQPGPNLSDGVAFVQSSDVGGKIDLISLQKTSVKIASRYSRSSLRPGDILFSLRGNIGQCSIAPAGLDGANIARGIARIRVQAGFDNQYVRYALQAPAMCRKIARNANGSTFRELSIGELRQLYLPFPPLPEQRKIAEILRTWDEAIGKLEVLKAAKERCSRAIFSRFFDPCHPNFDSRPPSWREYKLGKLFTERLQGGAPGDRLLSITMRAGVIDRDKVGRKDTSTSDKSQYKLILPGDIGYNTMRMWQGVSGLSALRGIVSPAYTVVTPISSFIDIRYAAHLFKSSRRMVFDFERYSQGLASDTWNFKFHAFSKIGVFLPPIDKQRAQANLLDALIDEISVIELQIKSLTRQKRGLMQKLLTGEWGITL